MVRVAFGAAVWAYDDNGWAEVFDKVPASASDGEEIKVVGDVLEYVKRCVMLEEEVHLNAYAANVPEHVAELHVFWV